MKVKLTNPWKGLPKGTFKLTPKPKVPKRKAITQNPWKKST